MDAFASVSEHAARGAKQRAERGCKTRRKTGTHAANQPRMGMTAWKKCIGIQKRLTIRFRPPRIYLTALRKNVNQAPHPGFESINWSLHALELPGNQSFVEMDVSPAGNP
jgi:hypothetical protein